jgi:PIN domain nuclease of toxin-antitoxin system
MRLLLDTHAFLWWWQGSARINARLRIAIGGADLVLVSAISAWEIAIKGALGRLRFTGSVAHAVETCRFTRLGVEFEHIEALAGLPLHHKDPFDRLLVAQTLVEGATLVTHDRTLEPYRVPTLWL